MKILSITLGVLLLIETTALLASHRYEFHTDTVGGDGYRMPTMWRCDRLTRKVVVSTFANQQWVEVKEPFAPPQGKLTAEQYLDQTDEFGGIRVTNKHDVFDDAATNKLDLQPVNKPPP